MIALPAQRVFVETVRRVKRITRAIASRLSITGPFNVQYVAKDGRIRVIECNLRASRSFPFASKVYRLNFINLATRAIMGAPVGEPARSLFEIDYVGVKAPQFSFARLAGADPLLGVEMASTGEVACFGADLEEAFLKSLLSVGYSIPEKGVLLSTGTMREKTKLLPAVRAFAERELALYATAGTAHFLGDHGIEAEVIPWPLDGRKPDALDLIESGKIDGEGPYRIIVPQSTPGSPDRGSRYSPTECADGWDFDDTKDHNAGAMVRGVIAIRVNPLPAGVEDFDYHNGGWAYVDSLSVIVYGFGVSGD